MKIDLEIMESRTKLESQLSPSSARKKGSAAFSIVIPVYNEEKGITPTLELLQEQLKLSNCTYEIVVVNDGSKDRTGEILRELQELITFRVIEHPRNRGYGAALKTGIRQAKYGAIVITDGDGTYPNERIPQLVAL